MKIVFLLLILALGLQILRSKDYKRLKYFFLSIIFLPGAIPLPTSGVGSHRFFVLAYLASLMYHNEIKKAFRIPCLIFFVFVAASYFGTGINDPRLSQFTQLWRPSIYFCMEYGLLIFGFCSSMKREEWNKFIKLLFTTACIINIYGIFTFLLNIDPVGQLFASTFDFQSSLYDFGVRASSRSRVGSFLVNSHVYGYFNALLCILFTYVLYKRGLSRNEKIILLLTVVGIFISGSRSSLMTAIVGIVILSIFGLRLKKLVTYALLGILFLIPLTQTEVVQNKISAVSDVFKDGGGDTGGSSVNMRENQLELSLMLFAQSPVWGNGFDYFGEMVDDDDYWLKNGINGAESYYFILLIDRGGVEIVTILILVIMLVRYFYKQKRFSKLEYSLALAMLIAYIAISLMTGNSGKWEYCMLFLGLLLNKENISYLTQINDGHAES